MSTPLFVYGSLLFDDVFSAVTGIASEGRPAVLSDYARYCIRDATYPAIVPEPGARTEGVVHAALDAEAMQALDRFEGDLYTRERVDVEYEDGSRETAETYVFVPHARSLLDDEPWHPEVHGAAARAELGGRGTD